MTKNKTPYIVIDTNVIISAGILPNSRTGHMLSSAFDQFILAQNTATWQELIDRIKKPKLDRYFPYSHSRTEFLLHVNTNVAFFDIHAVATECSDPTDNKFLGLALDAGATVIVSGDRALQTLHPYQGIAIYSPAEFLQAHAQ